MSTNKILMVYASAGKPQGQNSNTLAALFQTLAVTSDGTDQGMTIASVGGNFDFNGKSLANIGAFVAALNLGGYVATNAGTPVNPTDVPNKAYVDAVAIQVRIQENVAVATTGSNINLASAPSTIDGVTLTAGMRVLVKDQTNATQNGIYDFASSGAAMTRDASLNNSPSPNVYNGVLVSNVEQGTQNVGTAWVISSVGSGTNGAHTLGTDAITFSSFAKPTSYTGGAGIWLNGTAITANVDGVTLDLSGATANGSATMEVKAGGIGTTQLASGAVTAAKLGTVADGSTLDQSGAGSTLEVKAGGIGTTQLAAAAVTAAKLGSVTDGSTLDQSGSGGTLEVKAGGITETQIASSALASGGGLTGGSGTKLSFDDTESFTNSSGSTIAANTLVMIKADGTIAPADATNASIYTYDLGVTAASIANTASGKVHVRRGGAPVSIGSSLTIGTMYYADPTTPGGITASPRSNSGDSHYQVGRAASASTVRLAQAFVISFA